MADDLNALSDEEFRARWRAWLDENYPEEWKVPVTFRLAGDQQRQWHRMCWEAGWRAPGLPKEYGGLGLSLAKQLIYNDVLDDIRAARVLDTGGVLLTPVLMHYGTQAQRDRYFGPILRGEELWCQGYSEPGSGSDLASLRTSAWSSNVAWCRPNSITGAPPLYRSSYLVPIRPPHVLQK